MLSYSLRFCSARSSIFTHHRYASSVVEELPKSRVSLAQKEIVKHFSHPNRKIALEYPPQILAKSRRKHINGLYIGDNFAVDKIFEALTKNLPKDKALFEINPGLGMLSKRLIEKTENRLVLCEPDNFCYQHMKKLVEKYPNRDIEVKNVNFINLWKLEFLDKFDYGNRVSSLFEGLKRAPFYDDTVYRAFGCIGSSNFFKDLVNSIIFQNSFMLPGRSEFIICLPPSIYLELTCSPEAGYIFYRQSSILFQILFEYEFIAKINKKYFLPWIPKTKSTRKEKLLKEDIKYMYMVRVVPRKDIYKFCAMNHMSTLWFFIKQHLRSRTKPIIPTMERWIPGCGLRLIINSKAKISSKPMFPDEDIKSLPDFYAPCQSLTVNEFVDDIGVFTQFGKLTPMQILTIFNQFIHWPEYESSSFGEILEKNLEKMFANPDEKAHEIESDSDEEDPSLEDDDDDVKTV